MKIIHLKHFLLMMLTLMLCVACEKPSLSAPTGVYGTQVDNTIFLAWDEVNGAIGYDIYRGGNCVTVYSPSYTDKNPPAGNNYYYIYAFNKKNRSQPSIIVVNYKESETHGTTPLTSVSTQDVIGYWQLTPCKNSASFKDKWYIQFNTDGTFVEERTETTYDRDHYGVGIWTLQNGILNLQYFGEGYSRFYEGLDHTYSHTLYVTQFAGSSAELYLLNFTFSNDGYYTMQRLSYDDQSFSGNISTNGSNSISKTQLVGTWLYADKSGAHYYTFKNDGSYNRVYLYEYTGRNYNNYNGTFTISNNIITANVIQLIEAIARSNDNGSYIRTTTISLTEQYSFQSINGNSIVWKENGIKHRCFKVPASPKEIDL